MGENVCCGCGMSKSEREVRSRWWIDGPVSIRCAVVLTLMTLPTCFGLEEAVHLEKTPVSFYWAEANLTYIDPITNKQVHEWSKGKYGAKSLVEQRTGLAVHVRDKENKTHGCDDYGIKLPKEKWIALVERGNCYFTDKIKVATKTYNASAVVIYNNEDEGITIMQHSGRPITLVHCVELRCCTGSLRPDYLCSSRCSFWCAPSQSCYQILTKSFFISRFTA